MIKLLFPRLYLTTIILLIFTPLYPQVKSNNFIPSQFNTSHGLPNNDIRGIVQDHSSLIWFTTHNGLCSYDGYDFRIYNKDNSKISSNQFSSLDEDKNGDLWIATNDAGIIKYQHLKEEFITAEELGIDHHLLKHSVSTIRIDSNNTIWAISQDVVFRITQNSDGKYSVATHSFNNAIYTLAKNDKGEVLFLTTESTYKYDTESGEYIPVFRTKGIRELQYYNGNIYIWKDNSVYLMDSISEELTLISDFKTDRFFISSNNTLWLRNDTGIYAVNLSKPISDPSRLMLVLEDFIWTTEFMEDSYGNVWIGSYRKGLTQIRFNYKPFYQEKLPYSVECIAQDNKNNIWQGSLSGKIALKKENKIIKDILLPEPQNYESIDYIIQLEPSMNMAIGSSFGVKILTKDGIYLENIATSSTPKSLLQENNNLLIGTSSDGIIIYDLNNKIITNSLTLDKGLVSNYIQDIKKDSYNNIWVATSQGLSMIEADSRFISNPKIRTVAPEILTGVHITSLCTYTKETIAVGTLDRGLYLVSLNNNSEFEIKHISKENGLPSNNIKSILNQDESTLWISTTSNISKYDTNSEQIFNFNQSDGIIDGEFIENSALRLEDGEMIFGGINGYISFYPSEIIMDAHKPKIEIMEMGILNVPITPGDTLNGRNILPSKIHDGSNIVLDHNLNSFSFKFALLQYSTPNNYRYRYKLEGYHNNWTNISASVRSASFTDVKPGKYTFLVSGINNDNISSDVYSVNITIKPPIYLRWWAIIFYIIIIIVVYIRISRYKKNKRLREHNAALESQEKLFLKKLSEARMTLFSNASHELRTPLTIVMSILHQIRNKDLAKRELVKLADIANSNSRILLKIIDQILDLSKKEHQKDLPTMQENNIIEYVGEIVEQFRYLAEEKGIKINLRSKIDSPNIMIEQNYMERILYNLISNAIKHTPQYGEINCSIYQDFYKIYIEIKDTGVGIDKSVHDQIFNRFFTHQNDSIEPINGTGIGLSFTKYLVESIDGEIEFTSEPGIGSSFTISFPLTYNTDYKANNNTTPVIHEAKKVKATEKREGSNTKYTILAIDDNSQILDMLRMLLAPKYKILTAQNGIDGVKLAEKFLPNLIITDLMMPDIMGTELCAKIKNNPNTSHIPVIILTADASVESQKKSLDAMADGFCTKPFDNDLLVSTIESTLTNRKNYHTKFYNQFESRKSSNHSIENDELIENSIAIIIDNITNEQLSVDFLSRQLKINQITLNKRLKASINMGANTFIKTIRLKKAAELLAQRQHTIQEIVYMVGLNDQRHFRECFKAEYGVTPSEYIKQITQSAQKS